jgi:hypothetical protein
MGGMAMSVLYNDHDHSMGSIRTFLIVEIATEEDKLLLIPVTP